MYRKRTHILVLLLTLLLLIGDFGLVANGAGFIRLITPSEYFGEPIKSYEDHNVTIYTYSSYKSYPREQIAEYVKDMEEKGLRQVSQSTVGTRDICTRLEWKGENCITLWWRGNTGCLDVWVYSPVILVGNASSSDTEKKLRIPSPEKYFGTVDKVEPGRESTTYCFHGYKNYPEEVVRKCVVDLRWLGFDGGAISDQRNGDKQTVFHEGSSMQILIRWDQEKANLLFTVSDDVAVDGFDEPVPELLPSATEPKTTESETVPEETRPCSLCRGSGGCRDCDGSGLRKRVGFTKSNSRQTCYSCGGDGICDSCGGNCWIYADS